MDPKIYNTKEGIASMLTNLADFNRLIKARADAFHETRQPLNEFYLLGRFHADASGHVIKYAPDYFPTDFYKNIPPVLTPEEFRALISAHSDSKNTIVHGNDIALPAIPLAHLIDPISKKGWTIEDCHDAYPEETHETIDLSEYVGNTVSEVLAKLNTDSEKMYDFSARSIYRKDEVVQGREEYSKVREKERERERRSRDDSYVVKPDQMVMVQVVCFYHEDSFQKRILQRIQEERDELLTGWQYAVQMCGFPDAVVARAPLSERLRIDFSEGEDHVLTEEECEHVNYFRVETSIGSFGIIHILHAGPPMIDVHDSGITVNDLQRAMGAPVNKENKFSVCNFIDPEVMLPIVAKLLSEKNKKS